MEAYTSFARVYDTFMDNIPYEEWCEYLTGLMREYGVRDGLVLDLGCGTGNMTELLAKAGYDMIGADNAEEMLEIAMEKRDKSGHDILYLLQDMREFELYGTVRAVISVCDSVNYITEPEELQEVFRLVNNYLDPKGVFIFDFNTRYKYEEILGDRTIAENREECSFIWDNYYYEDEKINEYDLSLFIETDKESGLYRKYEETHYQRAYTLEEMKELIRKSGLEFVTAYDAFSKNRTGENCYMKDYIVRATAGDGQIRAFAATTGNLVEEARKRHDTSPVATAALGRLLTAGAMMGGMMKNETDVLTLQIKGDGPLGGITVTADAKGDVKGYVDHPEAMMPPKNGKLDVGGAVGIGLLNVIKDMGLKEPYVGQTILQTSEIAEDLTYYFATSEQVPSSVGLGVLMNKDNTVHCAGGFIVQVMPFISDEVLDKLEENIKKISSVTSMLDNGHTPEQMLEQVLDGLNVEFTDTMDTQFKCNCSHERIEKAIISIGKKDIQEMIDDGKEVEVKCHFCNTAYTFSVEELKQILKQAKR